MAEHGSAAGSEASRPRTCRLAAVAVGLLLVVGLLGAILASGQRAGFLNSRPKGRTKHVTSYVLFIPNDYHADRSYPLILFLHGWGDEDKYLETGLGWAIKWKMEEDFPFLALFPRVKGDWLDTPLKINEARNILSEVQDAYNVDRDRISLAGLSSGGTGVWHMAARYPDIWAAIVPVCGQPPVELVSKIKHIPCWCFQGNADPQIPMDSVRGMMDALRAAGGEPRLTELNGRDHFIGEEVFSQPELYDWLLEQRRH